MGAALHVRKPEGPVVFSAVREGLEGCRGEEGMHGGVPRTRRGHCRTRTGLAGTFHLVSARRE